MRIHFELTISLPRDRVGVDNQGELNTDNANSWGDSADAFTFSIAVTQGEVETLDFNRIVVGGLNQPGEQVTISESETAIRGILTIAIRQASPDALYEAAGAQTSGPPATVEVKFSMFST
ncbi:MAG: hypothetical protein HOO08_03195 [Opitutae bacterium]|jgi:hypothetical protein|nr:hypothetical protein [Opitutae bacterium]